MRIKSASANEDRNVDKKQEDRRSFVESCIFLHFGHRRVPERWLRFDSLVGETSLDRFDV